MDLFARLRKMKILLIDDDEWIRDSMSLFFEGEGCNLTAVETAEEGIDAVGREQYDIIIADYRLPGMDGIEFFKRIRSVSGNAIKIMVTAFGSEGVVSMAKEAGVNELIEKPFTPEHIEASLSRLIS